MQPSVVVIGGSAGSFEQLRALIIALPADFNAAVFIVIHTPSGRQSYMPALLNRRSSLTVKHPGPNERIAARCVYCAPPDRHMTIGDGHVLLSCGPKEHHFRPAINPLFRSAARHFGPRVIAVILSGMLSDGSAGMQAVKRYGGIAIVEDPACALFDEMPNNALAAADVDYVERPERIAPLLARLVKPLLGSLALFD